MIDSNGFFAEILRNSGFQKATQTSIDIGLRQKGMVSHGEILKEYRDIFGWRRGGAESYICAAEITLITNEQYLEKRKYICKALFTFGPSAEIAKRWVERYNLLSQNGIKVPRIYFSGSGVIIQDYIEHSLQDYIRNRCKSKSDITALYKQLYEIAECLDSLRFSPIAIIRDILVSTSGICFVVDVGEDLGGPGQAEFGSDKARKQVNEYFEKLGVTCPQGLPGSLLKYN
jgi:hypothetical protein